MRPLIACFLMFSLAFIIILPNAYADEPSLVLNIFNGMKDKKLGVSISAEKNMTAYFQDIPIAHLGEGRVTITTIGPENSSISLLIYSGVEPVSCRVYVSRSSSNNIYKVVTVTNEGGSGKCSVDKEVYIDPQSALPSERIKIFKK